MKVLSPTIRNELKRVFIALIILLAILAGVLVVLQQGPAPVTVALRMLPREQIVFDWDEDACSPEHIPDAPVRAFRDAENRVQLIIARQTNYRLVGPDFERLVRDCAAIMSSHGDPRPERFNDREWIRSIYSPDGVTVFALIHDEYQGHHHPGRCPSGNYPQCWYNAVTLAVSQDMGGAYRHAQPPNHLVASLPYPYEPDSGPVGVFAPSNIIRNPNDGYYYALVRIARDYGNQPSGACLMRTTNLSDPASWRAWDGRSFSIAFANPYQPRVRPEQHICQPVARNEIQLMTDSLTYNTYLDRFVLVGAASRQEATGRLVTGIYYALSQNLIDWTPRTLLMEAELPWSFECGDDVPVNYPAIIDPQSDSRNFDTVGRRAYLYFTRFRVDSCRLAGADLVRAPVVFHEGTAP